MKSTGLLGFVLTAACAAGCANLQTIGRSSDIPPKMEDGQNTGKVIHLDAQQRLLVVNEFGRYCAEPSPDALAAYASSLGLGASVPSQGAASVAQAIQSTAGSIGLRTQSIQLMRDALYRLCEAQANGALTGLDHRIMLTRSQDLTAVVVAIEQLTGAVVANQLALTPNASSSASANLVANQQLLEQARADETTKMQSLEQAKAARDKQKSVVEEKEGDVRTAQNTYDNTPSDDAKERLDSARAALDQEKEKLAPLENEVKQRESALQEAAQVKRAIEDAKNAALTQATAATGSSAQFSQPVQVKSLDKQATKEIAEAVEGMVTTVLEKEYIIESCLGLISTPPPQSENFDLSPDELEEITRNYLRAQRECIVLLTAQVEFETAQTQLRQQGITDQLRD